VQHPVAPDHHQPNEAAARQALRQVDYGHTAQRAVVTQEPQASPMSASSSRLVSGGRTLSLIRQAREDDPGQWFYGALAAAIDCSKELIAAIIKGRA
jgi:hypothetical protein